MQRTTTLPRWARWVPAGQLGIVLVYALAVIDVLLPESVFSVLVLGSPVVFGTGLGVGLWVARRRGAVRPDGSEYLWATAGNVLMGFGLGLSLLLWVWLATYPADF